MENQTTLIDTAINSLEHWGTEVIGFGAAGLIIGLVLRPVVRHGFSKLVEELSQQFRNSMHEWLFPLIPLITKSLDEAKKEFMQRVEGWGNPAAVPVVQAAEGAEIKRFIDARDFDGLYRKIDAIKDPKLRAGQYREIATICMNYKDKLNSFRAANKYRELLGKAPKAEQFLGYVYWWFKDIDTAIIHAENALQAALNMPEPEPSTDGDSILRIKNNLAFYYAEKQINKDVAFSYVDEILARTSPADKLYLYYIDTAGTVYLKFATSEDEVDKAKAYFLQVLEHEPKSEHTIEHLTEAFEKKKSFNTK
ncbi:MAG: hypothetical protein MN733_26420 [Nitrososphaera sp.]|nr:hypothetical protein [Nitrososphaera sp.]